MSRKVKRNLLKALISNTIKTTFFSHRFSPLIKIGRQKKDVKGVDSQEYLQHAEFVDTPTGGQGVIFVTENNIYHQPDLTDRKE